MSARLRVLVEQLTLRPGDRILEIGCGQGVAASYLCERLTGGLYLGIDRSPTMTAAAERRNRSWIDAGVAVFRTVDLESFDPGPDRFDLILAVRVGVFHREPARSRTRVTPWLRPEGQLVVVYDEPASSHRG